MSEKLRRVALVANREIRTIVFTKGFLLGAFIPIGVLFLMASLMPMAEKMMRHTQQSRSVPHRIGAIGGTSAVLDAWQSKLADRKLANGQSKFEIIPLNTLGFTEEVIEKSARKKVRDRKWDAYIQVIGDITGSGQVKFYAMRGLDMNLPRELMNGLRDVVREARLEADGLDAERVAHLFRGITWNQFEITAEEVEGEGDKDKKMDFGKIFGPAMVSIMAMFFLTFTTSQRMLRGIVEEKTTRIVEVLLSSLSSTELMLGKVIGFYAIGLFQFALWSVVGYGIVQAKGIQVADTFTPEYFLHFSIFLTTGYLFFASLFAIIGAMVGNETESQNVQGFVTIIIIIPLMFNFVLITQPNWWPVRLLSFVPFFSPSIMAVRLVAAPVPWWEIAAVAASTVLFAYLGILIAARIFRVGILMTGKRASVRELWRWCWYRDASEVTASAAAEVKS